MPYHATPRTHTHLPILVVLRKVYELSRERVLQVFPDANLRRFRPRVLLHRLRLFSHRLQQTLRVCDTIVRAASQGTDRDAMMVTEEKGWEGRCDGYPHLIYCGHQSARFSVKVGRTSRGWFQSRRRKDKCRSFFTLYFFRLSTVCYCGACRPSKAEAQKRGDG